MSFDIGVVKTNLLSYVPFSDRARHFARYVAREIRTDHEANPINDVTQYMRQKLDHLATSFDNYDDAPSCLVSLTEREYDTLGRYIPSLARFALLREQDDQFPTTRANEVVRFLNDIRAAPPRVEGRPRSVTGFPRVAELYVNNQVPLSPGVLGELEEIAMCGGER